MAMPFPVSRIREACSVRGCLMAGAWGHPDGRRFCTPHYDRQSLECEDCDGSGEPRGTDDHTGRSLRRESHTFCPACEGTGRTWICFCGSPVDGAPTIAVCVDHDPANYGHEELRG